jgi:hypothetical protein
LTCGSNKRRFVFYCAAAMKFLGKADMRSTMIWAATLAALLAASANADADEWCGYGLHDKSIIECGYTSLADCEAATGKGGMCFVDPELARNGKARPHFTALRRAATN